MVPITMARMIISAPRITPFVWSPLLNSSSGRGVGVPGKMGRAVNAPVPADRFAEKYWEIDSLHTIMNMNARKTTRKIRF